MFQESMDAVLSCPIMIITHVRPRRGHKYEFDMDFRTNEIFRHMFQRTSSCVQSQKNLDL